MPLNCRCDIASLLPTLRYNSEQYRSEVDDINIGLQHFYGEFNVVHARLISSGVSTAQDTQLGSQSCGMRATNPPHSRSRISDH